MSFRSRTDCLKSPRLLRTPIQAYLARFGLDFGGVCAIIAEWTSWGLDPSSHGWKSSKRHQPWPVRRDYRPRGNVADSLKRKLRCRHVPPTFRAAFNGFHTWLSDQPGQRCPGFHIGGGGGIGGGGDLNNHLSPTLYVLPSSASLLSIPRALFSFTPATLAMSAGLPP